MRVEVTRVYREGHWSIYADDINDWWQEYLDSSRRGFDKNNPEDVRLATEFIQSKYGSDVKVRLML